MIPGPGDAIVGDCLGESTVARLIPFLYDIDAGHRVDGNDIAGASVLQRGVTVFKDTFLFSDSCGRTSRCRSEASMEAVSAPGSGADDFVREFRRLQHRDPAALLAIRRPAPAILAEVLADPRILILDDATSSVDPSKEHEITLRARGVMQAPGHHRPRQATIALADRVVLIDGGKVIAEPTRGLLASAGTAKFCAEVEKHG